MTVKELIEKLKEMPQNKEVGCIEVDYDWAIDSYYTYMYQYNNVRYDDKKDIVIIE